ncbi:histidine phosphatase family protein [Mycobacterium sp. CVI_P3]|uniref:Histidine phosphatase family protein n=1 Tax=Mycobacterium pinniadriaticum TaxID=2994102 RepID=A0ABT3SDL2_9MYCO|nr:histidine phosphatase family protein [Mycobacterium pinniadriaticum]MCX2931170.1 histidine phosphatase family protein [Mycobacterium pinniadriaticum]MCX2937606.1 histidine phosphatase family protein [Mycobacterium pinniadriaticum]
MRHHTGARPIPRRALKALATLISAVALFLVSALPAWAADSITLTWVRHGESYGNVAGAGIDTKVPGPELTELGEQQAEAIAVQLNDGGYDSIYVSDMIRTHQTAAPLEALVPSLPVHEEAGIHEISAGIFEGSPIDSGLGRIGYFLIPVAWTLGLRSLPIPGGETGNGFEARVDDVIDAVTANGATAPVLFSHGATIMVWTMMNVDNPDIMLMLTHPLGNTAVVEVTGNPDDGWMLQSWDGAAVSQNPPLAGQLFVNARRLVVAPQTAVYDVVQAIKSRDPAQVVAAVRDGVVMVAKAGVDFVTDSVTDIGQAIRGALPDLGGAAADTAVTNLRSSTAAATTEETANGATDLTDGNKVEPLKASAGASRRAGATPAVSGKAEASSATDKAGGGAKKGTGSSRRGSTHKAAA